MKEHPQLKVAKRNIIKEAFKDPQWIGKIKNAEQTPGLSALALMPGTLEGWYWVIKPRRLIQRLSTTNKPGQRNTIIITKIPSGAYDYVVGFAENFVVTPIAYYLLKRSHPDWKLIRAFPKEWGIKRFESRKDAFARRVSDIIQSPALYAKGSTVSYYVFRYNPEYEDDIVRYLKKSGIKFGIKKK